MFKLAFTPRWLALLALILALASGFVMLSRWQLNASTLGQVSADPAKEVVRPFSEVLHPHEPLTAQEADTMVSARGTYVAGSSYLVADKLNEGEKGYWVVTELKPATDSPEHHHRAEAADQPRSIAVARAWTSEAKIPAEPRGEVTVAGRVVPNDGPIYSRDAKETGERMLPSAATAQLTNLWDAPLYTAILAADSETAGQQVPTDHEGKLRQDASIMGQNDHLRPVRTTQVTDDTVNWLNIFYALEWLVFAGFALYLWWRLLKDAHEKEQNPAQYFEYEGKYWRDEATGRYYYWDPADEKFYFFDEVPPATHD